MKGDPYWLIVRRQAQCAGCDRSIEKGSRVFYYPRTRSSFCEADLCGGRAARDFEAGRQDEDGP